MPLLFAYAINRFSHDVAHIMTVLCLYVLEFLYIKNFHFVCSVHYHVLRIQAFNFIIHTVNLLIFNVQYIII